MLLNVAHQFLPRQNSTRASVVMDHFGIDFEQGEHVIARDFELPLSSGQIVLFTGESGSGKSSLMRQTAAQLQQQNETVIDLDKLAWEERILVDLLPVPMEAALQLLASCGLAEAHLMLRTPAELSDGQRYRFRLAFALAHQPVWIVADEFTATLDRRLARMISFNLRKIAARSGIGFLLATTHDDVIADLSPDLHVCCRLDGEIELRTEENGGTELKKKTPSLGENLWISPATKSDWAYFARWHYRSHHIGLIRTMLMLWDGDEPVGICIFIAPPKALSQRNRYFGRSGRWDRTTLRTLNRQLVTLSRVVLHPTYRGAGIAHRFVRRCCELCPYPWVETLTQMGHINPFFERAGFTRVGVSTIGHRSRESHSMLYRRQQKRGEKKGLLSRETFDKSRYANPVYYIFDNRQSCKAEKRQQ